ncbi:hypothetical protein [Lutibacter sp.]
MNRADYTFLLQNPEDIDTSQTLKLEDIISDFPYFQSARSLLLKGLNKTGSYKYNVLLKKTAAYTVDREVLFNFITSPIFVKKNTPKIKPLKSIKVLHKKIKDTVLSENLNTEKETIEGTEILEIGKPIQFNSAEPHSFNEWMQLITQKTITREEKKITKSKIIDTFIKTNPKIKAIDKTAKNIDISPESSTANDSLMTETLAKVYLEQKKYENAIKAYHILSLKYPEKSGFFADRIKAIKILQNNKS